MLSSTCSSCYKKGQHFVDDIWGAERDGEEEEDFKTPHQTVNPNILSSSHHNSDSNSLPMEFIQVLIHQHAKTLVALKTLKSEVRTLKPHPQQPHPPYHNHTPFPTASTPHSHTPTHPRYHGNHTHPTKLNNHPHHHHPHMDSGLFSQKSSSNSTGDELYSLLSQIQDKVESLKPNKKKESDHDHPLGYLDDVLGNKNFDFGRFRGVDKGVVRAVLGCGEVGELKRQLLFCHVRVESLLQEQQQQQQQLLSNNHTPHPPPITMATKPHPPPPITPPTTKPSLINSSPPSSTPTSKSLIPVPIARAKKKKNVVMEKEEKKLVEAQQPRFLWGQWFN